MKELTICVLVLALGTLVIMAAVPEVEVVETREITVSRGDTIWGVINGIEGRENYDGQELVNVVRDMNDLDGPLTPGQQITIPKEVK